MAALDRESQIEERLALIEGLTVSPLRLRQRSVSAPRARPEPPAAFAVRQSAEHLCAILQNLLPLSAAHFHEAGLPPILPAVYARWPRGGRLHCHGQPGAIMTTPTFQQLARS